MEKHNLRVTILCMYMCVCVCRVYGILRLDDQEIHKNHETQIRQLYSKLKSKTLSYNKNGGTQDTQVYDKLTTRNLSSYNQNGHPKPRDLNTSFVHLISHNPVDENRPSYAFKGGTLLLQKTFMPDTGESTNRQSIVPFKSISRQGKEFNSDVSYSRQRWHFNKPDTILLERSNHGALLKEREFLDQYRKRKKLQGVFYQITQLYNDELEEKTDNDANRLERPSSQKRNQYIVLVHRVKKSVNEAQNSSSKTSKRRDNFVSQQLSSVAPIQKTNNDKVQGVTGGSESDKKSDSVKHDNVLLSGNSTSASKTSSSLPATDFVKQTNGVEMVTLSTTLDVKTNKVSNVPSFSASIVDDKPSTASRVNDKSSTQFPDGGLENLSSSTTTVSVKTSPEFDDNLKHPEIRNTSSVGSNNVRTVVTTPGHMTSPHENREHDAYISTSSPVHYTESVQRGQTTSIPKLDPSKQLSQNLVQLITSTTKHIEPSAENLKTAQNTKSFQHSTEASILPLPTSNNASKQEDPPVLTTVNGFMSNLPATIVTSSKSATETATEPATEPSTSQKSSPEPGLSSQSGSSPGPVPAISLEYANRTDVSTDNTQSFPSAVTEGSTLTTASGISPEPATSRKKSSTVLVTSTKPVFEGSSPETAESGSSSLEPVTAEGSNFGSVTFSSVPSISATFVETAVGKVTETASTKMSVDTASPVTQATEANPNQNSTIALTVVIQTSTSSDPQTSSVNNVETTHVTTSKAEVTNTPSSKSKEEPVATPEPTPESNPGTKNPYATMEPPQGIAEPGPDWKLAKKKWKFAWPAHLYLFGSVFTLIAVFVIASMIQLWQINRLLSRRYFFTLNLLIFYFCAMRAFYLFFDGYNSNGAFPDVLQYFLYSSVFPCLTSAFSILLFSLLTATQMQLVPPRIQKLKYLIVIILFHFVVQISSDIIMGLSSGARMMLFMCQLLYILWGLFLFCGYTYVFRRLYYSAVKRQKTFQYMTAGKSYLDESNSERKKFTLSLAVKVTLLAAVFGLVTVILEVYSIVSVYGVMSDKQPEAWAWWIYHTALRLTECLMCLTMSYIASQPFRYNQKYTHCFCYMLCAPCLEMSSCNHTGINDSLGWDNDQVDLHMSASRTNGQMNGKKKVHMSDTASIVPVVVQPSSGELSRPTSLLIIEDGYVRFQTDNDINKIVDSYTGGPRQEMLTFKSGDGIINGAYLMMEDPFSFDRASSHGYTRKSSLASSVMFRPPSSLSLADSMDMEIDKAFRSLRDTKGSDIVTDSASSCGTLTRPSFRISDSVERSTIEAYLEDQASHPLPMLRRSRSALGDISDEKRESWRQKLFRSRSDNSNYIKTKDLDNLKYFSLLDFERQHEMDEHLKVGKSVSGQYSSDDTFNGNDKPAADHSLDSGAARRLLTSSSDSDEIEV
ncbi:uncharacterized protein LOC121367624 [Gigantopelta aegis]|uniref:uncharacterized protein LOC121367624 n=1 Tax=Gigantopelta aegis TaxID=1735272 RepID=UPI001B88AF45|nr:uncharacterized protein LOC121367624 [Gigantopelta aegis]XP_041347846.1 uncharacterized protein LOC121367624 [Gigantopelta aegis]